MRYLGYVWELAAGAVILWAVVFVVFEASEVMVRFGHWRRSRRMMRAFEVEVLSLGCDPDDEPEAA